MIAGAYTLHLYCERCNRLGDFVGGSLDGLRQVAALSRRAGWSIDAAYERCLCPACKSKGWPPIDDTQKPA